MICRSVLLMLAAVPAACASRDPTLYTLVALPGTTHAGTPRVIELRKIALADYLTRAQIVRSRSDLSAPSRSQAIAAGNSTPLSLSCSLPGCVRQPSSSDYAWPFPPLAPLGRGPPASA